MPRVIASQVLANGLRTEFADTYSAIRNRQSDGRLGMVMDLSIGATNRQHEFAYFNAAPHMEYWKRGDTVPTGAFDSVQWTTPIYEWARRVPWSKFDRKDDQTQSLMEVARAAGASAALLPERFFFDLLNGTGVTLPAVPNAPDGLALYSSSDRFETTGGNIVSGSGGIDVAEIKTTFYGAIDRFREFKDGKGQPLLSDEVVDGGYLIIHPSSKTEQFEEAFMQRRQGGVSGTDAGAPSNIYQDASRNVELWGTTRLTDSTDDKYYIFLKNAPKKATYLLNREGVQEFTSLEGDNNSDHTRDTGEEYVQWETRQGAGSALPMATICVDCAP